MKKLYCPWREEYSTSTNDTKKEHITKDACIFCTQFAQHDDEKHYIFKRFPHCIAMLNLYPYNAGHLLVVPKRHIACISELTKEERNELMEVTSKAVEVLKETLGAEGINIGINLGKAAGAGIPSHIHMHVLPRWVGDTNFLPTLSETKTISFDINDIYKKLKQQF